MSRSSLLSRTGSGRSSLSLSLGLALGVALTGCSGASDAAEGPEDEASASSSSSAPATREAAPNPAPEPRRIAALPEGSTLVFQIMEDVSTATHQPGDRVSLQLVRQVQGDHGAVVAAGTPAQAIITESRRSGSAEEEAVLGLRMASIQLGGDYRDLNGQVTSTDVQTGARDSNQRSVAKVATGAAAGALVGQILGRDTRSTVAGAAAGAAAGLGIALTTRDGHAVLPQGSQVTVRLASPLVVP